MSPELSGSNVVSWHNKQQAIRGETPAFAWERDMANKQHYDRARHKAWRAAVIRRAGGLCEDCRRFGRIGEDGLPVRATTAHHVVPLEVAPERAYDVTNGRALCARCHNKRHPEKGGKYY